MNGLMDRSATVKLAFQISRATFWRRRH